MNSKVLSAACCLLCSMAAGQWSEPALVVSESMPLLSGQRLIAGSGDTAWVFYLRSNRHQDTAEIRSQWSTGGSWSAPQVVARDWLLDNLGVGVDPEQRVWLGWYNGDYPTDAPPQDSWGIWTCVRDSGRWSAPRCAISGPGGAMEGIPTGCSFGTDRNGNWLMGVEEQNGSLTDMHFSALYSRLEGDTWIWPRYIAQGHGGSGRVDNYLPTLTPHPEYDFWSAHNQYTDGAEPFAEELLVNEWQDDSSVQESNSGPSRRHEAVGDRRQWLATVYRAVIPGIGYDWLCFESFEPMGGTWDEVSEDVYDGSFDSQICHDSMGVLWLGWTSADTTPVVSYKQAGGWWSDPEPVTDSNGVLLDLTTDSQGRVYAMFATRPQIYYTTYRLGRPGVEQGPEQAVLPRQVRATILRGVLMMPAGNGEGRLANSELLDAVGRKVLNLEPGPNDVRGLAPGVYFVRDARAQAQAQAVRKVVITR